MQLTPEVISSLQLAKVLPPSPPPSSAAPSPFLSLDFDNTGDLAVLSTSDSLHLLSLTNASLAKVVPSRAFPPTYPRFTHHSSSLLLASSTVPTLRYLSLHDTKFLRTYHGHSAGVTSLALSPVDDTALSTSLDCTARLWDLRLSTSRAVIPLPSSPTSPSPTPACAFDPQGLIFAVTTLIPGGVQAVKLYDQRSYQGGPFTTFALDPGVLASPAGLPPPTFHSLAFAPDGQTLLLSSNTSRHLLLDAFDGHVRRVYCVRGSGGGRVASPAVFTPDAQWVVAGNDDGSIHVFDREGGEGGETGAGGPAAGGVGVDARFVLRGRHKEAVRAVGMSPTRVCLITAATEIALWLPPRDLLSPDTTT